MSGPAQIVSETMPMSADAMSKSLIGVADRGWGRGIFAMCAIAGTAMLSSPVGARMSLSAERELGRCISQASEGKLWLERTLWGLRDQEAGWLGAEIVNKNGSHDLGPLPINSWWVPRLAKATGKPMAH